MAIVLERRRGYACEIIDSPRDFNELVCSEDLRRDIQYIRDNRRLADKMEAKGDMEQAKGYRALADKRKRFLPGFVFQCKDFLDSAKVIKGTGEKKTGKFRAQDKAVLNGLFTVDFDHIEDPRALWEKILKTEGFDDWGVMLAFVTSSDHGLKLVMPARVEYGNLASNQNKFSDWCGVEVDTNTKDASRLSFAPCADDILYCSNKLFDYFNEEFYEKYNGKYSDGSSDADLFTPDKSGEPGKSPARVGDGDGNPAGQGGSAADGCADTPAEQPYKERLLAELQLLREGKDLPVEDFKERVTCRGISIRELVNAYFNGAEPVEGTRHQSLIELASDIRYITDFNKDTCVYYLLRLPFVQDLLKSGDDVARDIEDSLGYKQIRYMPKRMAAAMDFCLKAKWASERKDETGDETAAKFLAFGESILAMAQYFPTMKELTANVRTQSAPAVIFSAAAMYGTLATRTWYHFYHNPAKMRRLNYEVFVIADPANGKSSIGDLYSTIMSPIMADDEVYNKAINEYKRKIKEHQTKSDKNKKEGLVYPVSKTRIHGSRTANNIFIEDMVNNVEEVNGVRLNLHLFTFDAELDSADIANKGGQWIDKSIFELKAFHNEEDNQQYRNVDSVTGPFNVYWNFVYTGTPYSLSKKITKRNFGSGLSTRLAVIPLCAPKFTMMPFNRINKKDEKGIQTISEWAYKLHEVKGELPFWPLVEHAWRWVNGMMVLAKEANDETMDLFIRRVPYYGINVAAPFIIMRHYKEFTEEGVFKIDEHDKALCSLVMEIQYYTQRKYFAKFATVYWENRDADIAESMEHRSQTNEYLANMPDNFSYQTLMEICKVTEEYARILVKRWERQGCVVFKGRGKNKIATKTKLGKLA